MKKIYFLASLMLMLTVGVCAQTFKAAPRTAQNTVVAPMKSEAAIQLPSGKSAPMKAKKRPIEDTPDGELLTYSLHTYYYSAQMDEWIDRDAQKTMVVKDGEDIYIQNIINNFLYNVWIKGTLSPDHKTVTFDNMQPYTEIDDYYYYVSLAYLNKNGDVLADMESDEFTMAYDEATGVLSNPDLEICLCNEDGGVFSYNQGYVLTPFNDELVTLPEGLEIQPYSLAYESNYAYNYPMMVYVARDGKDFYFRGLSEKTLESWVKGTLGEDNVIRIPNGQYVGLYDNLYFLYCKGAEYNGLDEQGWPIYKSKDYAELLYVEEDGSMFGKDGILFCLGKEKSGSYSQSIPAQEMHPFYGVAAKPATPDIRYYDIDTQFGVVPSSMALVVPVADVDGNYINPDSLYFRVFVDGEQWKFDKDFYPAFKDEWLVNARFSDRGVSKNRTDFAGSYHILAFPKELRPKTLGLQSLYKMAGVDTWSDVITFDTFTEEKTIGDPAAIKDVHVRNANEGKAFNMLGQQVNANAKGIVIINGKKVIK